MTASEFIRITELLEKAGLNSDKTLKALKYIESGKKELLTEIFPDNEQKDEKTD